MSRTAPRPGFVDRRSAVFWLFVALVGLGIYWQVTDTVDKWGAYPGGVVAAVVTWLVYGVLVGGLFYRLQVFERRPIAATVAAVVWGMLVAGGVVAVSGEALRDLGDKLFGFDASREWGPAYRAPLIEETMKVLGVVALALIPRVRLTRVVDGLYYGMMSGLGFLLSENIFFSNEEITFAGGKGVAGEITNVMFLRGIASLPFSHVVYSAIAGAGVGFVMSRLRRPLPGRILVAASLFAAAFLLHGFQNSPLLDDLGGNLFIKGAPALAVFLLVLKWARSEYRADMQALAGELSEVAAQDVAMLGRRRARKKAAKGSTSPKQTRRLQQAQIDLLVAADTYGLGSAEADAAARRLPGVDDETRL